MFIHILISVILPIFALIGVGVVLDRVFKLDLPTMNKLNFYAFVPAIAFVKLLEAEIDPAQMTTVGLFTLVHPALLLAVSLPLFLLPALRGQRTPLILGTVFYNAGNYGIPLVVLAFGDALVGVIIVVMVVQNLLTFTFGIWLVEHRMRGTAGALAGMLKIPVIYAVGAAFLLRGLHAVPPEPVMIPLRYLSDGLIPIALLTLGAQLARTRLNHALPALSAVTMLRLVVSPLLAALLAIPFGIAAPVSSVLIVAAGFPVAVNTYILAAEYRLNEELASQTIFLSTLLSAATMAALLLWVK